MCESQDMYFVNDIC